MEYRTKASVRDGITKNESADACTRIIDYQPGNGTRYVLTFTDLCRSPGALKMLSVPDGGWLVTSLSAESRVMIVPTGNGFLHWTYVARHLYLNKADAVVVAELIGFITDCPVKSSEEVEAEDLCEEKATRKGKAREEDAETVAF